MTARHLIAAIFAACLSVAAAPARADIVVDVNEAAIRPLPVAVPAFGGGQRGAEIAQVITENLERSGLFAPISPSAFPETALDVNVQPQLDGWKQAGAQALINGQVTIEPDGRLRADFRLWGVSSGEQLLGLQFASTPENWRRVAHKISDAVYERLTGEKGYFDTRVVFVAESDKGRVVRVDGESTTVLDGLAERIPRTDSGQIIPVGWNCTNSMSRRSAPDS